MPTDGSYFDSGLSSVVTDFPTFAGIPTPLRKTSQETVRPRLSRSVTMPSSYHYENEVLAEAFPTYFDTTKTFHAMATAPTSPSSSSTSGSLLSSSADDHEYTLSCSPAMVASKLHGVKGRTPKKTNSLQEEDDPKIARPPNAWILYRSKKLEEFKNSNPTMYIGKTTRSKADRGLRPTQASFSKQIASMWAAEPASVKEYYHSEASIRSAVHAAEHPGYRFNPNKKRADKVKVKRERTKSGSPIRSSLPLSISTPQQVAPSVLTTGFCTPASATSPALIADKTSPQRQQVHQWALAPSNFISQICPPAPASAASSLDSPYAQERRPSLKAQWEAIFPNEASDGNLTGSSCSTPFPSSYNGNQSVSPLWGTNLLPSLSISEPPYAGNTGLQLDLPGAFSLPPDITAEQNAESGSVVGGLASPAQFSFAQPALSLPSCSTSPNFEYWSPMPDGTGITPSTTPFCGLTGASTLSPPAFDATSELVQPLPQVPDLPVWWEHRHVKVKPDEDNGIPLEDFIKNLNEKKTL